MTSIGTPFTDTATRVMLLGSGELGREVAIELIRYGCEVIAVDRYDHAPAMQVAQRRHVINMLDGAALRQLVEQEKPALIVPEIEAIATDELVQLESEGFTVVPTARAARLTMNREGIRRLAAEELSLPTSPYRFAESLEEYQQAVAEIGLPCVVKPVMSSSGKGQSTVKTETDIQSAWDYAQSGGRAGQGRVIVEGFVDFDYEITLLTVRHRDGTTYCSPIGHRQENGDYQESWQPQPMSDKALQASQEVAGAITEALGGLGIFGVELFIKGDQVYFSEVSPRPHDTGLVTLLSQNLSEFALHARAILGLPVPDIEQRGPSASSVLLVQGDSNQMRYRGLDQALAQPETEVRLFGKPEVKGSRRLGVALARGESIQEARDKANAASAALKVDL
ncbi:MAG: phosphoribosylglycinamide formyltransferase 2 [Alcanivorax sp.]|jgi:phosphoribosylglycinamide formyltransferase 2|uniref:formate-dependent phosphoribosylglycinamide formyltransferase n=1 Tax=Alcanivorax TaxID=59753 RepID=UPI00089FAE07|nr:MULTISPECIES: formate-dependent phosphoribosylglycinamide formyltransferase [Alcanivorax]MEE2869010.1 formate-dependent phosphoribosylglycinamide formyltransferase [Pseudomonadota bacterium]MAC14210.1 phosphoribosylglycinamide formyltransferase 2 [Alcanivorax sp.]MBG34124.1 phosphoribosylglycinamide formyltransferase 2 [Alcanivorax sp.]MBU84252.1 phosphoribosylglycinamide formyltransferase 2 [Alcanivorax sp.]MEE3387470.1 formate-dependent phosphoribosylglycinamide formyltransferase [Pseudom|tara:strand:+ start:1970 stop:3151 length:1182 start_codon:yes stop_codon:yes gene_type:complete